MLTGIVHNGPPGASPREEVVSVHRGFRLVAGLVALVATFAPATVAAQSPEAIAALNEYIVSQRSTYGLPTDPGTLEALTKPGADVGTRTWGFPMSAAEEERLDLNGRIRFADAVSRTVLPLAQSLPTYGGAYIDQRADGSLVVLLTALDPDVVQAIIALAPADSREVRVVQVRHTQAELRTAVDQAWTTLPSAIEGSIQGIGVDTMRNGIRVTVAGGGQAADQPAASQTASLDGGIPVFVETGPTSQETVCNNRNDCHTPLRAGVVVRNNTASSTGTCTMGFHIRIGTDEQWLTAGHCGCAYTATDWHHTGLGLVGNEVARMTNLAQPKDIMRVQMADAQASALVYGHSGEMGQSVLPVVNEAVFGSMGIANTVMSGTIKDDWTSWHSEYCNKTMYGGDTNLVQIPGDSGSPIYRRWSFGGEWYITPIGVGVMATGQFGRVKDAQDYWGFTVVTP